MARYLGTIQGERGKASRLGHRSMTAVAASWHGAVEVTMSPVGEVATGRADQERVRIEVTKWKGKGVDRLLYDGTLAQLQDNPPASPDSLATIREARDTLKALCDLWEVPPTASAREPIARLSALLGE